MDAHTWATLAAGCSTDGDMVRSLAAFRPTAAEAHHHFSNRLANYPSRVGLQWLGAGAASCGWTDLHPFFTIAVYDPYRRVVSTCPASCLKGWTPQAPQT